MLNRSSGLSQRELAIRFGMHASRLVGIVDEMESLGLVVREGNADDRRTYSLQITPRGRKFWRRLERSGERTTMPSAPRSARRNKSCLRVFCNGSRTSKA